MAKFYKSRYTAAQQDALLDIVEQGGSGGEGGGSSIEYLDVSGLDEEIQMALSLFCSIVKSRSGNNWYISSPIAYYDYGAKPVALGVDTSSTFSIEGVTGTLYEFFEMLGVKDLVDSLPRLSKEQFYSL